LKTWKICWQE